MSDHSKILDRLRAMVEQPVSYLGIPCRLAEVLDEPARIVLAPVGPARTIVQDSYGHPTGKGREFLELLVFDDQGGLREEIRQVTVSARQD